MNDYLKYGVHFLSFVSFRLNAFIHVYLQVLTAGMNVGEMKKAKNIILYSSVGEMGKNKLLYKGEKLITIW